MLLVYVVRAGSPTLETLKRLSGAGWRAPASGC